MTITVVAIAAIMCLVLWERPRALTLFALLCIIFTRTAERVTGIEGFSSVDDMTTLAVVIRGVQARFLDPRPAEGRHRFPGGRWFVLFGILGIASGITSADPSWVNLASGTFLALKGVLLGWAACQFEWPLSSIGKIFRQGAWLGALVCLLGVVSFLVPGPWASIFPVNGSPIYRYGLASAMGPFPHPFDLAYISSLVAIGCLSWLTIVAWSKWGTALLVVAASSTFLSFRRKDLLGLVVATAIIAAVRKKWGIVVGLMLSLPLILIFAFEEISTEVQSLIDSYFVAGSKEARSALLEGASRVANDYFPLGAGFGRFGSRTAAVDYSPEYIRLGLYNVYGLGPGADEGHFLTDTAWPAVIGESGWIGFIAFVIGIISFVAVIRQGWIADSMLLRVLSTTALGWLVLTAFQSTGAAVFTSPPAYGLMFVTIGVLASSTASSRHTQGVLERAQPVLMSPNGRSHAN